MLEIWALILVQVLFGINYVVSKQVVLAFPPLVWASIRITIATLLLAATAIAWKRPRPKLEKAFLVPLIGFALLGCIINQVCFLVGLKHTSSTNSALLNSLIPIFTLLIATARGKEKLTRYRALGFTFALTGVLLIKKIEEISFSNQTFIGDLLTLINCLSFGLFLNLSRDFLRKYDPIWCTVFMFSYGTIGIGLISIPSWSATALPVMTGALWAKAAFAVLGGTFLTYLLNNWALARVESSLVAIFIYLQPVVASVTAWIFMGEPLATRTLIASTMILAGLLCAMIPTTEEVAET